ncbi:TetR family transcriptional regulator [Streptomyces sp. NPDC002073]
MPEARKPETSKRASRTPRRGAPGPATLDAPAPSDDTPAPDAAAPARATAEAATAADDAKPRRRQARGERRIAQLLEAAAGVFCRNGYAGASTNAIAREAGVSPGTLYQFFPNKEAIAIELGGHLLQQAHTTHGRAFLPENLRQPLPALIDAVIDPVIAFNCENPAFWALMHGSGIPGITQEHDQLHAGLVTRIEDIVRTFSPDTPPEQLTRVAITVLGIFKSGLDVILAHEGAERDAYVAEMKTVLLRYLEPMVTTSPAR